MALTNRVEYIESIKENLRCPLDWGGRPEERLFLKKWYYTVSDHLPNGEQDAASLKESPGDSYLSEPSEESLSSEFFGEQELKSLFINSNFHKDKYRDRYNSECLKHHKLVAQTSNERNKHYILSAKNIDDIVKNSIEKNNVGLLLPNFTPEVQIDFYWSSINDIFDRLEFEKQDVDDDDSERHSFDAAWNALMTRDQFRICVDTLTTIGYYSGKEARWLIYDTSLSGGVTHCYPALDRLPNSFEAILDDLQGIKEAFINGRSDWP